MTTQPRLAIWLGGALALIIGLLSSAAISRADSSQRPMQTHDFTDVPVADKEFMEPFIDAFYHQGVTTGCSQVPLRYCPENAVTRGEMAVFIGRALGYVAAESEGLNTEAYFKNPSTDLFVYGVYGETTNGTALRGISETGYGLVASSIDGIGLQGFSTNQIGVFAVSTNDSALVATGGAGLVGDSISDTIYDIELGDTQGEIFGQSIVLSSNAAVLVDLDNNNNSTSSFTVRDGINSVLLTIAESGIMTINANTTTNGNQTVNGNHTVNGVKNAIVDTVHYGARLMYSVESPENWFEDFGEGQLVNGAAIIEIEPIFAETVNLDETYHVFLTPIDGWAELYITNRTATSFEVRSADRGSNIRFSYRIIAKRLGYEELRLEQGEMP